MSTYGQNEDKLSLINRRQRQILVHSFLYYQLNDNLISDHTFDKWSKELAELMKTEEAKQSVYYKDFKDFTGASGFDLPYTNPEIQNVGLHLIKQSRKQRQS